MLRFDEFTLDRRLYSLKHHDEELSVQRRTLDLLLYLIEHQGRVVSKTELLSKVWFDVSVGESALRQALHQLRSALGDRGDDLVTTVRGRGIRFSGQVEELSKDQQLTPLNQPREAEHLGREAELRTLQAAAQGVLAGETQLVTIRGEPGIGKTTLLNMAQTKLARLGFSVFSGAAREEAVVAPYWLWASVAQHLLKSPVVLDSFTGTKLARLRRLFPALSQHAAVGTPQENGQEAVLKAYDAFVEALTLSARSRPLALLFDDLHRADPESLALLQHLLDDNPQAPLLLIAALRDTEEIGGSVTQSAHFESLRERFRIHLVGLPESIVQSLLLLRTGSAPSSELLQRCMSATAGSPFLLNAAVDLLLRQGTGAPLRALLAEGDRGMIAARHALSRTSSQTRAALSQVSVLGRDFSHSHFVALAGLDHSTEPATLLEEAISSRLLLPSTIGYRFTHVLIQQALYAELSNQEQKRLHRSAARLFHKGNAASFAHLSEASHHALLGYDDAPSAQSAIAIARQAAQAQLIALGYEATIATLRSALQATEFLESERESLSYDLNDELAGALIASGSYDQAMELSYRSAEAALSTGHFEAAARAAATYGRTQKSFGDRRLIGLLQTLIQGHRPEIGSWLSTLVVELGYALRQTPHFQSGREASLQGLELARAGGDAKLLCRALLATRWNALGNAPPEEQIALAREALDQARLADDIEMELESCMWLISDCLDTGDPAGYTAALNTLQGMPARHPHPWIDVIAQRYTVVDLLARGELEEAASRLDPVRAQGRAIGDSVTEICWVLESLYPCLERSEMGELTEMAAGINAELGGVSAWLNFGAFCLARDGKVEKAQVQLLALAPHLQPGAMGFSYACALCFGAEANAFVENRELAKQYLKALEEHPAQRFSIAAGALYLGPKSYYEGLCQLVLNEPNAAIKAFDKAHQDSQNADHAYFEARARARLGDLLAQETPSLAQTHWSRASELARKCGATRLLEHTLSSLDTLP